MEGVSASLYKGFRGYWKRRKYERLDGAGPRRKTRVELAGAGSNRRRRFWRIRVTPKLRFFHHLSPKKLLIRLRDAYVKMMLGFANSRVFSAGFGGGGAVGAGFGFGRPSLKEYDEKVLIEIYKSLMAQRQLVPQDAGRLAAQISCRR
ncbi:PREDICTED: uncharacterized protein LOC104599049 [Nelumbo nucifera]|uniref:Uncharacterized protein n=2 Tax=Nelumbo nucifera TaxID=4432 RepID=A0A822Z3B0_NELNU|nr:PREDICTED: uncharacterized protein LOC104599049 [Nelumbo nucifera]DAD38181.1 TPA_asm: hypothetical protein HUJ06_008822 [Nelumbo nucifera]